MRRKHRHAGQGAQQAEPSDEELVRRLHASDIAAFELIYDRYSKLVFALCVRVLRDRQRAEEVMQDTFWRLWTKPESYDSARGKLSTFLIQIARSRSLDRLRAEKSRSRHTQDAQTDTGILANGDDESPLRIAIRSQERVAVRAAILGLSESSRDIIFLFYFEGLSQSEIAERLGKPLGTQD